MLRPRKHPLIDGPVVVGDGRRLRRWQIGCIAFAALSIALLAAWPSGPAASSDIPDEVWWRRLISSIALQRLVQNVNISANDEMRQRLAQLEAERVSLADRLAEAEQLIKADRSRQRLGQVVARRKGKEIGFEILLRTPPGERVGERVLVDVMAVRGPVAAPAKGGPLSLDIDRASRLTVRSPKVAETLQGRLASGASHLLVLLATAGNTSQTEALLVPVNGDK
ncbi:MAG: hypothetical protein K9J04_04940 [Burkholderiales bacterium]|nr:hypothetical protein [Burkholderiales bacterium]